ncbi:rhomboid family intramembrane serine protease [Bdellovibrio svalbardensis]|uniref:Rhomboid family intramembrane serine protease n=1 Tax=Bdellovibrio svalbardensis TaxID=2972972 RepID=A0ABT6DHD1_9BACT|nr:rhomboid family intramembrane serine protease [Bdellovibrio svalbardensis]MDG0816216.1 rhomboid family intramembrane serine protease [Bdellovibrio svalbardensis]
MEPSAPEETVTRPPLIWHRVVQTWLTRKPSPHAGFIAAISTFILVLGSIVYQQDFFQAHTWMDASRIKVFEHHQWWRLWTTLFAHADLGHLISNSILFFILGYFLTGYFGALLFPLAAFAFGGITNFFVLLNSPPDISLIGVSGVVYWMGGAWLALYFALDKRKTYLQRSLRIGGVALGVFMPATAFDPTISYGAHLIGFLTGLLYGVLYYLRHRSTFEAALISETITDE